MTRTELKWTSTCEVLSIHLKKAFLLMSIGLLRVSMGAEVSKPSDVPLPMYKFRSSLMEIAPFIGDKAQFSDPKNRDAILNGLRDMATVSKELKQHQKLKTEGFRVPAEVLQKQLQAAYTQYHAKNYAFAWRVFGSAMDGCSSCHTQVAGKKAPQWDFSDLKLSGNSHQEANFWYTIRNYSKAKDLYENELFNLNLNQLSSLEIARAIKRVLLIHLRIEQSPSDALTFLQKVETQKLLPTSTAMDIFQWKRELLHLSKLDLVSSTKAQTKESMEQLADTVLRDVYPFPKKDRSREMAAIYVSGILLNFINKNPSQVSPGILYWVGTVMDDVDDDLFTHSGDLYLKRCVEKFHKDPNAVKCLHALKEKWLLGYSGSAGTSLPEDVQVDLKQMEKLIGQ